MILIENIINELNKRYQKFEIDNHIILKYIDSNKIEYIDNRECIKKVSILLDYYIYEKVLNGNEIYKNILFDNYLYLKKIIKQKYISIISDIFKDKNLDNDILVDYVYEMALNNLFNGNSKYDSDKLFSENILNSVKKIINQNKPQNNIEFEIDPNQLYNISFLKLYIKKNDILLESISRKTGISIADLYNYLMNDKPIIGKDFIILLSALGVDTDDKLNEIKNQDIEKQTSSTLFEIKKNNLSFLREFFRDNSISCDAVAKYLGISKAYFKQLIYGISYPTNTLLNKILKIFDVKSCGELYKKIKNNQINISNTILSDDKYKCIDNQIKEKSSNIPNDKYDLSFLRPYIEENEFSLEKLADQLNIGARCLEEYIKNYNQAPYSIVNKLVKLLKLSSYEELKEKSKNGDLKKIAPNLFNEKYDLSILKEYITENKINEKKLAKYLNIPITEFKKLLDCSAYASRNMINKLTSLFKINTYKELVQNIQNNTLEVPEFLCDKMSIVKYFMRKNKISNKDMAEYLQINIHTLERYLYGLSEAPDYLIEKIIKIFNASSYKELKEKIENNTLDIPSFFIKKLPNDKYDISFFKDCLIKNKVIKIKMAEYLGLSIGNFRYYFFNSLIINKNLLDKLLELFNISSYEEFKEKVENNTLIIPKFLIYDEESKNTTIEPIEPSKSSEPSEEDLNLIIYEFICSIKEQIPKNEYVILYLLFHFNYSVDSVSNHFNFDKEYIIDIKQKYLELYYQSSNEPEEKKLLFKNE